MVINESNGDSVPSHEQQGRSETSGAVSICKNFSTFSPL